MKTLYKKVLGIFVGIVLGIGCTYYILNKIHDKEVTRIQNKYNSELQALESQRDSVINTNIELEKMLAEYKALIDSFELVDEHHKAEIDRLNMELLEALDNVLEASSDLNYDFLQQRYVTTDTLQFPFAGNQVDSLAIAVVENDYNDNLLVEYAAIENALRGQLAISEETINNLVKNKDRLNLLVDKLYRDLAVKTKENSLKDEEIAKLKKALRMWKAGSLGAGAFVVLVLLLI